MSIKQTMVFVIALAVTVPAAAQEEGIAAEGQRALELASMAAAGQDRTRERQEKTRVASEDRKAQRDVAMYEQAQEAMDNGRWDRAVKMFSDVAAARGSRADAALYWLAYSQNHQGQRTEALGTIEQLAKAYPDSRYLKQARALEVEVRRDAGQPVRPENQTDEDLKLMALQALQNSDPEQAVPMLQKLLAGNASPRLKSQALFVLAQSSSPRARQVLLGIAKGESTPDLQMKAIQYLGIHGGRDNSGVLSEIFNGSSDPDVKRRVLRAFMISGDKERVLAAAQGEKDPDVRAEAVRQLGIMGGHEALSQLYQKESSIDIKKQILQAMFIGGDAARLVDLARTEQNPELRRAAVRNLGLMRSGNTATALIDIYNTEKDVSLRRAVIEAFFLQGNAESLVALARKEQNADLKKDIVEKLSLMKSKVATDYILELLNK